jgi:two-component system phosphate regulon sensor histidine kinase PhoR
MKKRRLLWQLYTSYLAITLAALIGVGWFAARSLDRFYDELVVDALERDARWLDSLVDVPLDGEHRQKVEAVCRSATEATDVRVTIILPAPRWQPHSPEKPITRSASARRPGSG